MPTETSMKRTVLSLSALVLCAASARAAKVVMPGAKPAAPAPGAAVKPVAPAFAQVNEVEKVAREAAQLEKSDGCEAADIRYQEAGDKLITMRDQAREAVRKERSAGADLNYDRAKLPSRVADLADLYRTMDQTRMLIVDLREGLLECDSLEKQLTADSTALKESIGLAQDMVLGTYKE